MNNSIGPGSDGFKVTGPGAASGAKGTQGAQGASQASGQFVLKPAGDQSPVHLGNTFNATVANANTAWVFASVASMSPAQARGQLKSQDSIPSHVDNDDVEAASDPETSDTYFAVQLATAKEPKV